MERRAIQIAVLIFTLIVLFSVFVETDSILDWCFPDNDGTSLVEDP
jgi:hypothetical protein